MRSIIFECPQNNSVLAMSPVWRLVVFSTNSVVLGWFSTVSTTCEDAMNNVSFSIPISDEVSARRAAAVFSALGNDRRLLVLAALVSLGEVSVGELSKIVRLNQSALSQHLSKLRAEHLVETRRERQFILYRPATPLIKSLISAYFEYDEANVSGLS